MTDTEKTKTPEQPDPKKRTGDARPDETGKPNATPKASKPDPARYGDWTVNGIAVDF